MKSVRTQPRLNRGFTLVECLAAVLILGIGIYGVMASFGSIARGEDRSREIDKMHRLAIDKFNELKATTDTFEADDNGDFSDRNEPNFTWELHVEPTGIEDLDAITVTVHESNESNTSPVATYTQTLFQVPADANGGTTSGTTGGTTG